MAATEYKDIGAGLAECQVITKTHGELLRRMGGYRNRLVHFYHEIDTLELYEICSGQVNDIEQMLNLLLAWVQSHPEEVDTII